MVTARLAIGSMSAVAVGAILLGSIPYWMHRGGSGANASPWGAISSLDTSRAEAAPSPDKDQLLKLAALKSGGTGDMPVASAIASTQSDAPPQTEAAPVQAMAVPDASAPADPQPAAPANPPQQVATAEIPATADAAVETGTDKADRININTATSSALDHLPGAGRIGRTIISHRPYKTTKDLVSRRILRTSDFQKIQSHISVD